MKISCNILKKHIKNSSDIDFLDVWNKFTIRTAEVEEVVKKGYDITGVVVGQIIECQAHPESKKLHVLKVDIKIEVLQIVCGASNVEVGLKVALIKVGGTLGDITITPRSLAGIESFGMCLAEDELGIGTNHDGIMVLPSHYEIGTPIKEYLPQIEDIIVEIDNKSLTNRPDLWGHYGLAREIAAITNHELLPLELIDIKNDKQDLPITIENSNLCYRYTGIKLGNITCEQTPYWLKIFLEYAGMRSISLIVDITNYIMLELGQPLHAFDANYIDNIKVSMANDNDTFITLDKQERKLTKDMLMIKNNDNYLAIAGVMGGLVGEVENTTEEIVLESATFEASSTRKTATKLGLRTEASARYEKALDPNLAIIASRRFITILKSILPNVSILSNLTDNYPNKLEESTIKLNKSTLKTYMGTDVPSDIVKNIFNSLEFKTIEEEEYYLVTVPTYRCTKDITIEADLIEEVSRMYGYENFELTPLKLDLNFKVHETIYDTEDEIKRYLVAKFGLNEVHTYLWYKTSFLKEINVEKNNIKLLEKTEDNILRDDLSLSLVEGLSINLKNLNEASIFEIGTVITNNEDNRSLSIGLGVEENKLEEAYNKAKSIVYSLFYDLKNTEVTFNSTTNYEYNTPGYSLDIIVNNEVLGNINIVHPRVVNSISKKKGIVTINIDFTKYLNLEDKKVEYKEISKYQTVNLDYTIITSSNDKYERLMKVIKSFKSDIINEYSLLNVYINEDVKKYLIRYNVGRMDKTLTQEELTKFKEDFITHIESNNYQINK